MPAIGITGGIATGKSAFCDCLRQRLPNAAFFNADVSARELADTDPEVRSEIQAQFGPDLFSAGHLNRAALRAIVFASAEKRRALEQILHPRIRRRWSVQAQTFRNSSDFFFADIPLLYETAGENLCDRVVVVACAEKIQRQRLQQRSHIDSAEVERIIASQMSLNEKMKRADHVVWNDGGQEVLAEQTGLLVELWRTIKWTKV